MMNQAERTANQLKEIFPHVFAQNADIANGLNHAVAESKQLRARHLEKHGMTEEESQMQSFNEFLRSL